MLADLNDFNSNFLHSINFMFLNSLINSYTPLSLVGLHLHSDPVPYTQF